MPKLYAKNAILLPAGEISKGSIFESGPAQAKQLERIGAARPATAKEIAAVDAEAKELAALTAEQAAIVRESKA